MNRTFTVFFTAAILLLWGTSCKNDNCPPSERDQLDITFYPQMVVQGQQAAFTTLSLQYPTDCDGFTYRGTYTVSIENPEVVPSLDFAIESGGTSWTNSSVPTDGMQEINLYVTAAWIDGVRQTPVPGTYSIEIRASFSDPQEVVTKILEVTVLENGLNLVILEPNRETQYPEGTSQILLQALVVDSDSAITSISYQIDNEQAVFERYQSVSQVNFEAAVDISTFGNHTLRMEAFSGSGSFASAEVDFFLPSGTFVLREHRWDGGGDGFTWEDPLNWENDRLPRKTDRAIIDLPSTDYVRLTSPGLDYKIFEVGAVDINAQVYLEGSVLLSLEQENETSYFRRSLYFNSLGRAGTAFGFGVEASGAVAEIADTLFIGGALLQTFVGAPNRPLIRAHTVYDGEDINWQSASCQISGGLDLAFTTLSQQLRPFNWNFYDDGSTGSGSPRIENLGRWEMVGGSKFLQNPNDPTTTEIHIADQAQFAVSRIADNSDFTIEGRVQFHNEGTWTDYPAAQGIDPGTIVLRPAGDTHHRIDTFMTAAEVDYWRGLWTYTGYAEMPKLHLVERFAADTAIVELGFEVRPTIRQVIVDRGELRLGRGRLHALHMRQGGVLDMLSNIWIDSLVMDKGVFSMGETDTVTTSYLAWRGTKDRSMFGGAFRLIDIGSYPASLIDLGPAAREWKADLILGRQTSLEWRSGNPVSDRDRRTEMHIADGAGLVVNSTFPMTWGFLNNGAHAPLYIYNQGVVIKRGAADAEIYGCLNHQVNGYLLEESGSLRIDDFQLNCN